MSPHHDLDLEDSQSNFLPHALADDVHALPYYPWSLIVRRLRASEDIDWTKAGQMDKDTVIPIYMPPPLQLCHGGRGWGGQ